MIVDLSQKRKGGSAPFLLAGLLAALGACATPAASVNTPDEAPARVLFVGNSFTYYNNSLHNHYRKLLQSAGISTKPPSRARILTISGAYLPEHAAGLRQRMEDEPWDVVVMHGHSLGPISAATADDFREAAREYVALIRSYGSEPVFFMTWAYTGKPEMTEKLDKAYSEIGEELGSRVVPVGIAFATATSGRPDLALRTEDARHPSVAGTYLAACTFFAAFQRKTPQALEYTAGLDADDAAYLQSVAWQTVIEYGNRSKR